MVTTFRYDENGPPVKIIFFFDFAPKKPKSHNQPFLFLDLENVIS